MFCPFPLSFPDIVADGPVLYSVTLKEASRPLRWSKTVTRWGLGSEMSSQCSCFFQVCPSSQGLPSTSVSPGGWTLPFLVLVYTPRPAAILTGLIRNKGFMGYQALWDCLVRLPVSRNQGLYSPPTGMNSSTSHPVPSSVTQAQASPAPCEQTYQDAHPSICYTGTELQMIY